MAKKKTITKESVKEQDEFVPNDIIISPSDEQAIKSVAKKKGLSSFGAMLKAQNAKRKERKKLYGKEN